VLADQNRGGAPSTAARTESYRGNTGVQRAPSTANRGTQQAAPRESGTPTRTYRSGGGMSQALERQRAPAQSQSQVYRAAPAQRERAAQPSTGMPRESTRGFESQASPPRAMPQSRDSGGGGMSQAQRGGGDGGSYRGGGGGSSRSGDSGGGRQHAAARGNEGRASR
jgi:hypothetical protein